MNHLKYTPCHLPKLSKRTWPDTVVSKAPRWCSVDLRDGNQALSVPMDIKKKQKLFELLVEIGFKEIEVGFPAASEMEFKFVRSLIEKSRIPRDVTIQVLAQSRAGQIERTFESLRGAKKATINIYTPVSPVQMGKVLKMSMEETKAAAVESVDLIRKLKKTSDITTLNLEFCPESFMQAEQDYVLEVCHAVMDAWQPTEKNRIIFNLASTVEVATPNIFADRVEWFSRNIHPRDKVIISVHTHNDRGTAVAAAELALMAGAERAEGSLFGNGERSGNMDIVTIALNLFSQGVDPNVDLSDINKIRRIYKKCSGMDIHPRHPYAGELAFTAFSGAHQDAINKCLKSFRPSRVSGWNVPYLPIDPCDIGRSKEPIIRINSLSGKGGIAYFMEKEFGIIVPETLQAALRQNIKSLAEHKHKELLAQDILSCYRRLLSSSV